MTKNKTVKIKPKLASLSLESNNSKPFKIKESSITTLDHGSNKEYQDVHDAYQDAINYLALQEAGSKIVITTDITIKRTQ